MWQGYQENYIPLENQMIDRIEGYGSEEHKQQQMDKAVTAARINTPGSVTAGAGMDPSNGNFSAASGAAQNQTASGGLHGGDVGPTNGRGSVHWRDDGISTGRSGSAGNGHAGHQ